MGILFKGIISTSLAVSLVILLVLIAARLLHRYYKPSLSCIVWLIIAVRLLIPIMPSSPPSIAIPLGEGGIYLQEEAGVMEKPLTASHARPDTAPAPPLLSNSRTVISPFGILAMVWLTGAVLSILAQGGMYLHTRKKLLRWCIPIKEEARIRLLERCKKEQGICKKVSLYQCGVLTTPLLMGLFSPCILLPDTDLTDRQLGYILMHELAHFRRRDLWFKLLLLLVRSVHWFNPLVSIAVKRAEAAIEIACDADVLQVSGMAARKEYGDAILSFLQAKKAICIPITTNFFEDHHQIIRRFEAIIDTKRKRNGGLCILLIIAAALFSTTLVGCVNAQAANQTLPSGNVSVAAPSLPTPIVPQPEIPVPPSQEELKELYTENPEKYQAEQAAFQEEILRVYGAGKDPLPASRMTWPVPGHYRMISPFGWRYDGADFHSGIDISDSDIDGQPVVAAADATVVQVNTEADAGKGYGSYVILNHGGNLSTLYAHLGEVTVQQGDTVTAGQLIGKVGSTGFTTEPQLHFEVRHTGVFDDVKAYLLPTDTEILPVGARILPEG